MDGCYYNNTQILLYRLCPSSLFFPTKYLLKLKLGKHCDYASLHFCLELRVIDHGAPIQRIVHRALGVHSARSLRAVSA